MFLKNFYFILIFSFISNIGFAQKKSVFVSIPPQAYFAERICGKLIDINILLTPGENPAFYNPSPIQISKLVRSNIFFRIGIPFEHVLLEKINTIAKNVLIINTGQKIKLIEMVSHHHHKENNSHTHEGLDPHTWMSPVLAKEHVKIIYESIIKINPENIKIYKKNYTLLINDLDNLHKEIAVMLKPVKGKKILVFHPSYSYFANEYGLEQIAIEQEGKSPKPKELAFFIKQAYKENINTIFIQPQFDKTAVKKIAQTIGAKIVEFDPLAFDYVNNLRKIAKRLARK